MMYEKRLFNFLFLWVVTDHTFIISLHYGSTYTRTKMTIPFYIQGNRLIPSTSVLIQYLSIACITEYEVGAILQSSSRVLEKEHLLNWKNYMAPNTYIDWLPRAYCMNWLDNRLKPRDNSYNICTKCCIAL